MATSAFRSTTKRELQLSDASGAPRRAGSLSDSSRYFSDSASAIENSIIYQDASSQRDSDQESFCPDDPGAINLRHLTSDSESEASSIIDRFRQTCARNESFSSVPRFQQSTASARGRQRTIEPHQRRSLSREPVRRSFTRSESEEPGYRRRSESREPGYRRGESKEPTGRTRRSESQEPGFNRSSFSGFTGTESNTQAGRTRRSEWQEPGFNRFSLSKEDFPEPQRGRIASREPSRVRKSESQEPGFRLKDDIPEPEQRGRSSQRGEIVFTSGRARRSESQEPRGGRSYSREPGVRRRSESQGPGVRFGALKQHQLHDDDDCSSQLQLPVQHHPGLNDFQAEERTITAVHAQLKANDPPAGEFDNENLYGAMRAEVRKAVADLKTEIEKSLEKDMITLVKAKGEISEAEVRKHYAEKLEQSESRTQELLSQLAKEEETRHELAKLVINPTSNKKPEPQKPEPKLTKPEQRLKTRSEAEKRRSISKALDEEAQKYFEEFASISASESEEPARRRPRTSPSRNSPSRNPVRKKSKSPPKSQALPAGNEGVSRWKTGSVAVNTDGVVTPWLDWETDSADVRSFVVLDHLLMQLSTFQDTLPEINWDSIAALTSAPADELIILESGELQRLRFRERLEAGRIHLCKGEFFF